MLRWPLSSIFVLFPELFPKGSVSLGTGAYIMINRFREWFLANKELILPLFKSLVLPHHEHAVQFWSPNLRRDIEKIEKIHRRATKMIPEIRYHSYHQRIQDLDLICLVQRRLGKQLIECLNTWIDSLYTVSARGLFDYDLNDRTRNNGAKLL